MLPLLVSWFHLIWLLNIPPPFFIGARPTDTLCARSQLPWSFNSLDQSPCQVAANLGAICEPSGTYQVPALPPGQEYHPGDNTTCECNTVFYSVISACAACQGEPPGSWSVFVASCPFVNIGVFPKNIPSGTLIPHWAYENITNLSTETFDISLAQSLGDTPEFGSSGTVTPPTSSSTKSSSSSTVVSTPNITPTTSPIIPQTVPAPSTTPTPPPTPISTHTTNVGAIAGGTIAGVVAVLFIAILVFLRLRTLRNVAPPAAANEHVNEYGSEVKDPSMQPSPSTVLQAPSSPSIFPQSAQLQDNPAHNGSHYGYPVSQITPVSNSGYIGAGEV
ncbi:hypothetical protein SISSUDRAFT_1064176 [Sistotremastrum suecicum HHB10207 ss-3]|uniref:Uncharacterized protein n=1 Tax=Sistotremastrum suecicum HHB10207 ss-3 TaxID=1314776 RepID=A0A166AXV4_9AGAM|nr:hypothetical protein SISSUDRAFT_1064176 [Sistotremastrum suecicum HHB10207 ss-3]